MHQIGQDDHKCRTTQIIKMEVKLWTFKVWGFGFLLCPALPNLQKANIQLLDFNKQINFLKYNNKFPHKSKNLPICFGTRQTKMQKVFPFL